MMPVWVHNVGFVDHSCGGVASEGCEACLTLWDDAGATSMWPDGDLDDAECDALDLAYEQYLSDREGGV